MAKTGKSVADLMKDLQRLWPDLTSNQKSARVSQLIDLGVSRRAVAKELGKSESGLRGLLQRNPAKPSAEQAPSSTPVHERPNQLMTTFQEDVGQFVEDLRNQWKTLQWEQKAIRLRTLINLGLSSSDLGREIGVSSSVVRELLGRLPKSAQAISTVSDDECREQSVDGQYSMLPEDCGNSGSYQGIRPPACAAGSGCRTCWNIYQSKVTQRLSSSVVHHNPLLSEEKVVYRQDFDDLMGVYKDWIGWKDYQPVPADPRSPSEELHGLIINDLHAPYHDEKRFRYVVEKFRGKVDLCVVAGDLCDFYNFSRYMKYRQHFTAAEEFKAIESVMATLSEAFPRVVILKGNHDERAKKYFMRLGVPVDIISFLEMVDDKYFSPLAKMASKYPNLEVTRPVQHGFAEFEFFWQIGDLIIGHPEKFSKIPNKAVGDFSNWLRSVGLQLGICKPFRVVAMGHTHQAGVTWNDGGVVCIEMGCMCLTPDYASDPKLNGALRPSVPGYTVFVQDRNGVTDRNATRFYELPELVASAAA